jgi:AcrR family transcriptional regulator
MTSEERRICIVEAACRLFADKGFRGTTTRELAAAVGVTEPVLYEHFKTKRDLYAAIIEKKAHASLSFINEIRSSHAEGDDFGFFTALGKQIVDWYTKDPAFIRLLLFSSLEGHELRDLFHQRTNVCFSVVGDYVRGRIAAGAMRGLDPDLAVRAFFGMIAHYALTGLVFGYAPLNKESTQVVSEMTNIFLNGMYEETKHIEVSR